MTGAGEGPLDPFERGQRDTEALKRALDDLREDVRAMVRQELERADPSRPEVERLVREAVAREIVRATPAAPAWRAVVFVAVGVVVGVFAGAFGYRFVGVGAGDAGLASPPAAIESGAAVADPTRSAAGDAAEDDASRSRDPAELAALYDSLFAARSDTLEPLIGRLEEAGPVAAVSEAVGAWRSGQVLDEAGRRRLHDALVQIALNEEAGAGLVLDGLLTRDPCGGSSCGALLDLWRERGGELGMPPWAGDAAGDTAALGVAERVLVLRVVGALEEGS